ncbi:hypothetical protein FKM82_001345 [Ascaphus truei]
MFSILFKLLSGAVTLTLNVGPRHPAKGRFLNTHKVRQNDNGDTCSKLQAFASLRKMYSNKETLAVTT